MSLLADILLLTGALFCFLGALGLLRYTAPARALATVYWHTAEIDPLLGPRVQGLGQIQAVFGPRDSHAHDLHEIRTGLARFVDETLLFEEYLIDEAAAHGVTVDGRGLARDLGVPVVLTAARQLGVDLESDHHLPAVG